MVRSLTSVGAATTPAWAEGPPAKAKSERADVAVYADHLSKFSSRNQRKIPGILVRAIQHGSFLPVSSATSRYVHHIAKAGDVREVYMHQRILRRRGNTHTSSIFCVASVTPCPDDAVHRQCR